MRVKAAQIAQELIQLLTSAGIGYALGRIQQRAHDEGRIGSSDRHANTNRDAALSAQQAHVDYLKQREQDVKP